MLRRPLHRDSAGASDDPARARAAAGKEILVAGAAPGAPPTPRLSAASASSSASAGIGRRSTAWSLEELSRPARRTQHCSCGWKICATARPRCAALYEFLNLPYRDEAFAAFARPHNVNRPEDRLLDAGQRDAFEAIAGDMQARLGYADRPEYVVNY